MSNISEGLADKTVPIEAPLLHPDNKRIGDVENIKASLIRFGQVRPIIVQKSTGYVVAGNHTMKAARELGWTDIAAIPIPLSDDEALAYLIADNRLGQLGGYDDAGLAAQLEAMMLAGKLEGTGYTPDEVDDMLSALDALPTTDQPTDAEHGITDDQLNDRYKNLNTSGPLRQFVLMYTQDDGQVIERYLARLARAWGMAGAREVVKHALELAAAQLETEPTEGGEPTEAAKAHGPGADPTPAGPEHRTPDQSVFDDPRRPPAPGEPAAGPHPDNTAPLT